MEARKIMKTLSKKILSVLLMAALTFGASAGLPAPSGIASVLPMNGVSASGGAVINLNESWFGTTNQSDDSGIWDYTATLNFFKVRGDVTVTGNIKAAEKTLTLEIDEKAKVIWTANYTGSNTILINLRNLKKMCRQMKSP